MTPPAAKRTALQEERGADARTIVDGEPLLIENDAAQLARICVPECGRFGPWSCLGSNFRRRCGILRSMQVDPFHGAEGTERSLEHRRA